MNCSELAGVLSEKYNNAPKGDKVLQIHLFAIKFASEIRACDESTAKISEKAGIGSAYGTEISKGLRLADYVSLEDAKWIS